MGEELFKIWKGKYTETGHIIIQLGLRRRETKASTISTLFNTKVSWESFDELKKTFSRFPGGKCPYGINKWKTLFSAGNSLMAATQIPSGAVRCFSHNFQLSKIWRKTSLIVGNHRTTKWRYFRLDGLLFRVFAPHIIPAYLSNKVDVALRSRLADKSLVKPLGK